MRVALFTFLVWFVCAATPTFAGDASSQRLQSTIVRDGNQSLYYWKATGVDNSAQLLTLFCRSCQTASGNEDVPLIALLRDTLGDSDAENDRITYVWLLSYSRLNLGQRMLSAVPFFYWRVGDGSKSVNPNDIAPLMDLATPERPVMSEIGRDIFQYTMLDPMTTPIRASSRAYRTNELDHERLHLEEAISYLRQAPVGSDDSAATRKELDTVIARLELRKRLLGGLVSERRAAQVGAGSGFELERIRSRNWEVLRQCAEKTGLLFEPIDLAGNTGQYAILWFPLKQSSGTADATLSPIWKLLDIKDPWTDERLMQWHGTTYDRAVDENGSLLPLGEDGSHHVRLVPLGVYSLNYPRVPLLLIDFRDKLHVRRHEMTQRTINEVTAGVIGISHFTNWYYYVAADLYEFVVARRGGAVNQAARLDCYSEFRVELALDQQLNPELREDMQRRIDSLALNPLEGAPQREMQAAIARYERLQSEAQENGKLAVLVDKERRSELASFGESKKAQFAEAILHDATFGAYNRRSRKDPENVALLDCYRRVQYHLDFLDALAGAGTQPEVAYESSRIQASVTELSSLMPRVRSQAVRGHAEATLERLKSLSQDAGLRADCSLALVALKRNNVPLRAAARIPTSPTGVSAAIGGATAESDK